MVDSMTWEQEAIKKWIPPETIEDTVQKLREEGKTIATLNGSFDLMHAGHLHMIFEASKQADVLIVALNTDSSIQAYKGKDRPIIPLKERLHMMAALYFVTYVTWFSEGDPRKLLEKIRPDVHVNGTEYGSDCIESGTVKEGGGKIYLVPRIPHLSTSSIIQKIQGLKCAPF